VKVLLIGGSGTLGKDLSPVLAARHEVFAPPHGANGLDLASADSVRRALDAVRPDAVVNAAALAEVDRCEREPELAFQLNADAVRWLAVACAERRATLVQVSTDYVFDGGKGSPYLESDRPRPIQVYGKSKLQGEVNALEAGGRALVVRTSWLFGVHGRNFPNRVLQAAREGGEIKAVTDWFGSPTSTADLAVVLGALLEKGATGLLHAVSPGVLSRMQQAEEILALRPGNARLVPVESSSILGLAARRPANTSLASERLAGLGIAFRPREEAVRDFVAGYTPPARQP